MRSDVGLPSLWALEGKWTLSRITKHSDGTEHRMSGESVFQRSGPRLTQVEKGVLTGGDNTALQATRSYVWVPSGDWVDVHFEDMRPFHRVPLRKTEFETTYLCPPDRYEVRYGFSDWPKWTTVWTVEGPRKSYVMTSEFTARNV